MKLPLTGGCICGAIRYECHAEPMLSLVCHCRQCQRSAGSAYNPIVAVPKAALKITGTPRYREYKADSGNTARDGYCAQCGTHVLGSTSGMPEMMALRAANLDDPSGFKAQMHVYTESAQPWDRMDDGLPQFPKMPPMGG
jgi:hypothetical protein